MTKSTKLPMYMYKANCKESCKGVSSVVGVILILAILASTLTVFLTYKVPILQKRAEFRYECDRLSEFSKVLSAYNDNSSAITLNLGGSTIFGSLHTDSTLSVKKSGRIKVTIIIDSNNTKQKLSYTGNLTALNYTIFCTKLPYIKASISEGGMKLYQNGRSVNVAQPDTVSLNNKKLIIYIENSNSNFLNEVAGTGYASVKIHCKTSVIDWNVSSKSVNASGNTTYKNVSIKINVTDSLFNDTWYIKLSRLGKVNVNGKYLNLYLPNSNLSKIASTIEIVRRNISIDVY